MDKTVSFFRRNSTPSVNSSVTYRSLSSGVSEANFSIQKIKGLVCNLMLYFV